MRSLLAALALSLFIGSTQAENAKPTIWSIYWTSDVTPCDGGGLLVNSTYPFDVRGSPVSIMPRPSVPQYSYYPYDQGQPITVVGYQLVQVLSENTAHGWMMIGAGNAAPDGPDNFAMTAGIGTNIHSDMLPAGGFPFAPSPTYPGGYSHFDVYGSCDRGTQQAIVNIFYTSP